MTIALSNALATTQTALLASQLTGGFIRLFAGTRPTTPDQAEVGTLLGIVTNDGVAGSGLHFTSAGAILQKSTEPWVFYGVATGTAAWFRIVQPGDTGAADMSALRIDGDIGTVAGVPGDMNWTDTGVLTGVPYTLDQFFYLIQPVGH
jgi:hypothetical protein